MVAQAPAKRKAGERGPAVPILTRLQVRALYLNECLPSRVISERTGLPIETVNRMVSKEGWTAVRRAQKERLIQNQDVRGDEIRKMAEEAIAERATLIATKALTVTEAGLDQGDLEGAKQAQAASSTLKNLVTSARVLQSPIGSTGTDSAPTSFNLFFVGAPGKNNDTKQAEAIEVQTVAKQ